MRSSWLAIIGLSIGLVSTACRSATPTTPGGGPGPGIGSSAQGSSAGGGSGGSSSAAFATSSGGSSSSSSTGTPSGSIPSGASSGGGGSGSGGGSTGSSGGTGSGGSTGDAGSGSTAADAAGGGTRLGSVSGCGQATFCTPGTDLAPPAASEGFQIASPSSITVQPGQEAFLCYYRTLPNTAEVDVGAFQSWMTTGSSHHFIAYQIGGGGLGSGTQQADGTLISCPFGGGTWVYATSLPGQIVELKMPTGVGLPLPAGTQIMLNMHFINPGSTPVSPQVKMNILYTTGVKYKAASMTSFNQQINVPAATATGPGTQTVKGTCNAPAGSNFFIMTTHTHKHATLAEVNYVSGGQSQNLVHTTDWENPDVRLWNPPTFLTLQAGDSFTYSCSYANSGSSPVVVGDTAASNEMCMLIGYYYPAGTTSCL